MSRTDFLSTQPKTVYYHKHRWIFLLLGLACLVMAGYSTIRTGSLFLVVLFLLHALWMLSCSQLLRIVVSPTGITYYNSGLYVIDSAWSNVDRIMAVPTVLGTIRCLVLQQPAVHGWTGGAWLFKALERGRTIPLTNGWARRDQLEQHIRQYVPTMPE